MALPLIGLPTLISGILAWLVRWYFATALARYAVLFAGFTFMIGLMSAFVVGAYATLGLFSVVMPPEFNFAMSFLPPSAPGLYAAYLSLFVGKRILDWKLKFMQQVLQESKKPSWLKGVA